MGHWDGPPWPLGHLEHPGASPGRLASGRDPWVSREIQVPGGALWGPTDAATGRLGDFPQKYTSWGPFKDIHDSSRDYDPGPEAHPQMSGIEKRMRKNKANSRINYA